MEVNSVLDELGLRRDFTQEVDVTKELDQNTFLRLFITQLENQDPLNPTANEEFVAQLAQFSALEQATQTTSLLEQLITQGNERGRIEAVKLIGHEILATGNTVELDREGVGKLVYRLAGDSTSGTITISDLTGKVVRTLPLDNQRAGEHTVEWDGLDNQENTVAPGVYQFAVNAVNEEGAGVPATTFMREVVKSATWENGKTELTVTSGKSLSTDEVLSIF